MFIRVVREAARLLESEPQYGAWAWEIHHHTKKDAPSGTLLKLVEEMEDAGYSHPIDTSANRAGRASGHARDRIRFGGRYHHAAAHGPQPRRFRARSLEGRAVGCPASYGVFKFEDVLFGKE